MDHRLGKGFGFASLVAVVAVVGVVAGCGGSSPSHAVPTARTEVAKILSMGKNGIMSLAHNANMTGSAMVGTNGVTGGSGGSGNGAGMGGMMFFPGVLMTQGVAKANSSPRLAATRSALRFLGRKAATALPRSASRIKYGVTSGGGGSNGDGPPPPPKVGDTYEYGDLIARYDEVTLSSNADFLYPIATKVSYFLDTAFKNSAGYLMWSSTDWSDQGASSQAISDFAYEERITAGAMKGFYAKSTSQFDPSTNSGFYNYQGTDTDGSQYQGSSKFNADSATFDFEYKTSTGYGFKYIGKADANGFSYSASSTDGYQVDWTWNADGSGNFRIVNPANPLTPATGVYDSNGNGVITFADGSKRKFNLWSDGGLDIF